MRMLRNILLWLALAAFGASPAMAGTDNDARGLAANGINRANQTPIVLASGGRMAAITTSTGTAFYQAAAVTIPANTVKGGERIEFGGSLKKYQPFNANLPYRITLTNPGGSSVVIAQASLSATIGDFPLWQEIQIASDRKSAFSMSINAFNIAGPTLIDPTSATTLSNTLLRRDQPLPSATAAISARTPSLTIMFASYTAPPTVETVLVDFTQPVIVSFDVSPRNGDVAELFGPFVRINAANPNPINFANPHAILVAGDSLTEGNNSVAVSGAPQDYVSQLRRLLPGYPVDSRGLGGQITSQITARVLADPVSGKQWKLVLETGANDINTDGPTWWAAMYPSIDQVVAFRGGTSGLIITNLWPRQGWATNSAYYIATQYVNAQLLARYGSSAVADLFSALATVSGSVPLKNYASAITTATQPTPGLPTIVVASATGIAVGQYVYTPGSTNIDAGNGLTSPTVTNVTGTTITLSTGINAALSAQQVIFVTPGEVHWSNAGHTVVATALQAQIGTLGW